MPESIPVGFSSTVIGTATEVGRLADLGAEVVEVCGCSHDQWPAVRTAAKRIGVPIGLHCPLPFDGWVPHFDITGPDPVRQADAFALVESTLRVGRDVGAAYVLVHFPSVIRDPAMVRGISEDSAQAQILASARRLADLSVRYAVPILLENVGPNPFFYYGAQFARLFEKVAGLRMCLDFGHVHVLPIGEDVYQFSVEVAPYVGAIHVYNATRAGYRVGFHEPPLAEYARSDGWMDLSVLLRTVARKQAPPYFIFEFSGNHGRDAGEVERGLVHWRSVWRRQCCEAG
jgi:sugar phosphate isomerase/epimerase